MKLSKIEAVVERQLGRTQLDRGAVPAIRQAQAAVERAISRCESNDAKTNCKRAYGLLEEAEYIESNETGGS